MRIPDTKIDDVRTASDIVDVVSSHVSLKKRGKNYVGLCPFHQEKTPSFNVSPDRQMYHCFGCGVGGNVFTFVMELERVSFVEALRTLADRAGIALPAERPEDRAQATENEGLYIVCRKAGLYYYENLTDTVEGKLALEYFHHRGLTDETIRKFGLGYAMNSWDGLIKFAEREGIDIATLEKDGLALKREDAGGYYDRFRGRAMFPFFSTSGRTVGFGARKLREDDPLGKYMNSPETPIYNKSRILYGIFQSKDAIREKEFAVLVEGYIDLISLFQAGVENVVATSGTALTEEQIQLIGRYAKNITLVYDADSAGSKASIRGVDLIIENGLDVRIAELPSGEDPDSFVKKNGGPAFQRLVENAVSFLDFKAMLFQAEGLFDTPDGQTQVVRSIVETISKMKDELKRSFYVKRVSEKYGIYETVLYRELEKLIGQARARGQFIPRSNVDVGIQQRGSVRQSQSGPDIPAPERDLLKLMLEHENEMVRFVITNFEPAMFTSQQAQQVIRLLVRRTESGEKWDANSLINEVEDAELKHLIANLLFSEFEISKGWAEMDSLPEVANPWEVAERCIAKLRIQKIDALIAENQRRMKEAEVRGEVLTEYHERNNTLNREKSEIRSSQLLERREH